MNKKPVNEILFQIVNEIRRTESENGVQKILLVQLAVETGLRLNELLNLKWSDFKVDGDQIVILSVYRGRNQRKIVSRRLYERLEKIKSEESVFNLSVHVIQRMFKRLRDVIELDYELNFHSLRKLSHQI